jgi:hypothetical protein
MPFKAKSKSRHHIPRQRRRVTNWASYEASLRQRGGLTLWFSEDAIAGWKAERRTTQGGQPRYSALAIVTALTLRAVYHLGLRQTEGLIASIFKLLDLPIATPDHTTLSRRSSTVEVPVPRSGQGTAPMHLLVDSTGLKFHGPGEWTVEKHGTKTRRSWRKLHLGVNSETGEIVATTLTAKETDDGAEVGPLLDQIGAPIASFTGDGAYDAQGVSRAVLDRHPAAEIIVPPRVNALLSETGQTEPTQRDRHLAVIQQHGRSRWQSLVGYTKRARVENAVGRFKRVIGGHLRSTNFENQKQEVKIGAHVLNKMTKLGRPQSIRVA